LSWAVALGKLTATRDPPAVRFVTVLAPLGLVLLLAACAPRGRVAEVTDAESCLPLDQNRWVVSPGDSQRVLRTWIDEEKQVPDGWSTYGLRRLRSATERWNRLRLPVRMELAESRAEADIEVSIVDSVPAQQQMRGAGQSGATSITTLRPGEIEKAHVLVAVAASYGVRYRLPAQEATLLHELGHALGLPHATGPRAVMSEQKSLATLTGTDIALARSHYSRPRCSS
jgi:hypothetical protein